MEPKDKSLFRFFVARAFQSPRWSRFLKSPRPTMERDMKTKTEHLKKYRLPIPQLTAWTDREIESLAYNMVKEAINDVRDNRTTKNKQLESKKWLMSDDHLSPFSASNCCDLCNLDIHNLRWKLNRLTDGALYELQK